MHDMHDIFVIIHELYYYKTPQHVQYGKFTAIGHSVEITTAAGFQLSRISPEVFSPFLTYCFIISLPAAQYFTS